MNHPYFDYTESADNVYGGDTGAIITLLAGRFIGTNPETPYVYRAYHEKSIPCNTRAQYIFDFEQQFPGSPDESIVWAAGELWRPGAGASAFLLSCFGPVQFFINEERVFSSTGVQEGDRALTTRVPVTLLKGCNIFVIRCEKTATGFGCTLSNAMPQWEPCNFLSPFAERSGRAGFVFTPPMAHDPFAEGAPQCNGTEEQTGLTWLPEKNTPLKGLWEVFNGTGYGYAWTVIDAETKPLTSFNFQTAKNHEPEGLWLEGQKITPDTEGNYTLKNPGYGRFNILVCTKNPGGKDSAFSLRAFSGDTEIQLSLPVPVKGARGSYLYAGLFPNAARTPQEIMQLTRPFKEGDRLFFWRTQEEQVVIRPFVESPLYGRWTYPLGVTLYGLLKAGEKLGRTDFMEYVRSHVQTAAGIHDYALYDKETYGFPGLNHQIAWLDALDDCGSFGSLLMECEQQWPTDAGERLGNRIARYMKDEQIRLQDGAFYRGETMWADDTFMSVPFLTRYALKSGDGAYFDDACRQLLLYRKYLAMEDCGLMSHIKSFRYNLVNRIPWSRGNGWVIFALSQLLTRLPAAHEKRNELIAFYNFLVKGYLKTQDTNGLWRQVLNDPLSYEESSATAMFICAFTRGIIEGYIEKSSLDKAIESCKHAWHGLASRAIDRHGNIYGVCRGSGFSFSRSYYRTLSWNFNDTHGIGIIMLAGVEWINLQEHLAEKNYFC